MVIPDEGMSRNIEMRETVSEGADPWASSTSLPLVNLVSGEVTAIHPGLIQMGMRVRLGARTDLRVRWPLDQHIGRDLSPGESIRLRIPAESVHLEAGYFRLGKRRWNRWIGRIVLVESLQDKRVVSVKLHNDPVTLKCCGSMTGSNWVPHVWDTVNVVVDPTKISFDAAPRDDGWQARSRVRETIDSFQDARVWLRAQIMETGDAPEVRLLSLLIGAARVSVLVDREGDSFSRWRTGMTIEIHIGRHEAWVKPCGSDCPAVRCGLLYLDHQSLAGAR